MFEKSILFVDDEPLPSAWFQRYFSNAGYKTFAAASTVAALDAFRAYRPAIVVTDLRLGHDWGIDLVTDIKSIEPATRVVVVSGWASVATTAEAMRAGAELVLGKPMFPGELLQRLEQGAICHKRVLLEPPPTLKRATFEHAMRVFTDAGGNMSEAARRLGIHRQSLQRLLGFPRFR